MLNYKGDASCHHNHIHNTILGSVRPIFQTLNTIPEHILYSLKVPILGQFQHFSAICKPNYGGRIQPALGTEFVYPIYYWHITWFSGIECTVFAIYSVFPRGPLLRNFCLNKPNYGGRIQPALGTEFVYPIYYYHYHLVLESDVSLLQCTQFFK